ncbi:MAG: glycosyltransferase [Candidatus Jordarchaeum sp.]|uniref:glycosyltransferase n=1 Tax=Candidatus Jordarchaeum sp. TaxID=2823881 RepID=UPI004049D770
MKELITDQTDYSNTEHLEIGMPINVKPSVSIIIPIHNEIQVIKKNLEKIIDYSKRIFDDYQIIIAEDGSKDGTDTIIKQLVKSHYQIVYLHFEVRQGKGKAIKRAIKIAREKIVAFIDADLAAPLIQLPQLVQMIQQGFTMAVGSRLINGSHVKRPTARRITSTIYNLLVRVLFRDGVHDHQCGFKVFNRDHILPLLDEVKNNEFFFDTELIIRVKRNGNRIIEVPIKWIEPEDRNSKFQLVYDGLTILIELLKLRIKLWMR